MGGEEPRASGAQAGGRWIFLYVGSFFALVAHFCDFLTHLKLSCIFVTILCDVFGDLGGFGWVSGRILGGFFDDFG